MGLRNFLRGHLLPFEQLGNSRQLVQNLTLLLLQILQPELRQKEVPNSLSAGHRGAQLRRFPQGATLVTPGPCSSASVSLHECCIVSPEVPLLKKRPSRITELETQLAQAQEDLKKAKDQVASSESCTLQVQQGADETKKQLLAMAAKLEESQLQLVELSAAEEARLQELHKLSQERDWAWQSELEALQKQHSADSATLATAMNEIQRLKLRLELVSESEAAHAKQAEMERCELQALKVEMSENLSLVEIMNFQVRESKESEARAQEFLSETLLQLDTAKTTIVMLQSDQSKAMEEFNSATMELEELRTCVKLLEEKISKLQCELALVSNETLGQHDSGKQLPPAIGESDQGKVELTSTMLEVEQLKSALEAAEIKYQEEQIKNAMQTQSMYDLLKHTKFELSKREAELEAELKQAKADIMELKANLMDKETALQGLLAENEGLSLEMEKQRSSPRESILEMEIKKLKSDVADLKANLMDKEKEFQGILEESEFLKSENEKREVEKGKENSGAIAEAEMAKAAEREALMRLGYMTEEADESSRRASRVAEQLEAAQVANSEMEAELRRLRVQSDQWRKAAEAAAAALSTDNNGKLMERSTSMDNDYHPVTRRMMGSPYSEDMDDDSPKKKSNMLKRMGLLWKKGQK